MILVSFTSHGGYETKLLVRFDQETGEEVSDYASLVVRRPKGYGDGHVVGACNRGEEGLGWTASLTKTPRYT